MSNEAHGTADSHTINISADRMVTMYSNMTRGLMTPEEIILDFGFNPNVGGRVVDEPAELTTRIILSAASAVRLHQLLHALLAKRQQALQQVQQAAPNPQAAPTEPVVGADVAK